MLTRILLLLGESPSSLTARRYAFQLARDTRSALTGLAGVDLQAIAPPMPGAVGSTAYKAPMEKELERRADAARTRLRDAYQQACAAEGVTFEWSSFDGDAAATVALASELNDVIVTGYDTAFHADSRLGLSDTVRGLVLATPRPVILCADEAASGSEVLIGYDGSVSAMRALQMFALLDVARGRRVHVTSIDPSEELAVRRATAAAGYLRNHGFEAEVRPVASGMHPAEALRVEVADRRIGLLVMGTHGRRGWRELVFGSTTTALVERPPCPLFVYH